LKERKRKEGGKEGGRKREREREEGRKEGRKEGERKRKRKKENNENDNLDVIKQMEKTIYIQGSRLLMPQPVESLKAPGQE
jgi:hypothetical protein